VKQQWAVLEVLNFQVHIQVHYIWHHQRESTQWTRHPTIKFLHLFVFIKTSWFWINECFFKSPHHIPRARPQYPDGRRPVLFPVHPLRCNAPQLQAAPLHSVAWARNIRYICTIKFKTMCTVRATRETKHYLTHPSHLHQFCSAYRIIWQSCYIVILYWVLLSPEPWRCFKMTAIQCTNLFQISWNDINDTVIRNLTHKPPNYFTLAVFSHKSNWCTLFLLSAKNLSWYFHYYSIKKVDMGEACAMYKHWGMHIKFGKETLKEEQWAMAQVKGYY